MSDRVFYVGASKQDNSNIVTGYVPAKFLTVNGRPVVDPSPGGSQVGNIYADGSDKYKTRGEIANPNNYLIVPANYTEQQARAFAADIAKTGGEGPIGQILAVGRMSDSSGPTVPKTCSDTRIGEFQKIPLFGHLLAARLTISGR